MSAANTSSSSSPTPANAKRKGRSISKAPADVHNIRAVDQLSGAPTMPKKAAAKFRSYCGIIARERVDITLPTWRDQTEEELDALIATLFTWFTVPEDDANRVRRYALMTMGKAWRNFKSVLVGEYVKKEREPFAKYPFLNREVWTRFVELKSTEDFDRTREARQALAARNKNPHRLGTAGYAGKIPEWEREDEAAVRLSGSAPFGTITDTRARNWIRARSSSGSQAFKNPADEEVSQRLVRLD